MLNKYRNSPLLQDIIKVLGGNIVAQGFAFLSTVVISRDLGPAQYGEFALIVAIFTFMTQFSDFGTSTSYVKFLSGNKDDATNILSSVIIFKIVTGVALSIIVAFCADSISAYFFQKRDYAEFFILAATALTFHTVWSTFIAHLQGLESFQRYSLLSIAHHGLRFATILMIALLLRSERHFSDYLYTYFFVACALVLAVGYMFKLKLVFRWSYIKEIYVLGFWIFLSSIAVILMMRIDVVMLQKLSDAKQIGYYSAASSVAMIFPLITMSVTATLMPKMEMFLQQHSVKEFIGKVGGLTKYVVAVSVLLQLISPVIIGLTFGAAYQDSIVIFCVLIVSYMFGVIVNPISLVYYQVNKAFLLTSVNWGQLLIGYLCNLALIPSYGAIGAAVSSLLLHIFSSTIIIGYLYIAYSKERIIPA
jgi:O-antigen/teichoic acid export membrane protein